MFSSGQQAEQKQRFPGDCVQIMANRVQNVSQDVFHDWRHSTITLAPARGNLNHALAEQVGLRMVSISPPPATTKPPVSDVCALVIQNTNWRTLTRTVSPSGGQARW